MKNPLTPLSKEDQAKFDHSRISANVVQNKCASCGAWYETNRLTKSFTETFDCDCGKRMSFDVPPQELQSIITPTNEQVLSILDGDLRLDTGMTAKEAIKRAAKWWTKMGAIEFRMHQIRQKEPVGGSNKGAGAAFASPNIDDANFLPSAIIHGKPWAELNNREKLSITKIWHHYFIRVPDKIGGNVDAVHKIQATKQIN